ncbi:MAG: IS21 family transposase [Bacteroidetes bacterium]|nr:IS21 family transposase [Bacteroidota bacterium]
MANKPISMTQVRRIIQLKSAGLSKLKISQNLGIHRKTLNEYLFKLELTGKSYQDLLGCDEAELAAIVYNTRNTPQPDSRLDALQKRFPSYARELKAPGVTRQILWQEYKMNNPDGYGYTQFCEHFSRYNKPNKATMHFDHRPGEYLQVDFAGKPLYIVDRQSGELIPCPVLVCVLPFSNYPYIEALPSTRQVQLFSALNRCLESIGGVPRNILSDNMKQYVSKNDRYEFKFPELVDQWSLHYGTNLEATRPRKPKDKPSVENNVHIGYLRVYAELRNETFFSLFDLNKRIKQLIGQHIHIPFQKKPYTRYEQFTKQEKSFLNPLPSEPFIIKHNTKGKVQMNYHVILGEDKHQYSVPYQYIGQRTKIIYDEENVEIFIGFERIAIHKRDYRVGGYTTLDEHMPENHLRYKQTRGWDADYFMAEAAKIGDCSVDVFKRVLASKEFIEQTYLSCKGLKRLSEIYGPQRFEAACQRAMKGTRVNYGMIKNILKKNLDKQQDPHGDIFAIPKHDNIRGEESYR